MLIVSDVGVDDPRVWVGGLIALSTLSAFLLWRGRAKTGETTGETTEAAAPEPAEAGQ